MNKVFLSAILDMGTEAKNTAQSKPEEKSFPTRGFEAHTLLPTILWKRKDLCKLNSAIRSRGVVLGNVRCSLAKNCSAELVL